MARESKKRPGVMLYPKDWVDLLDELDDAELGMMLRHMIAYLQTGTPPAFSDRGLRMSWSKIQRAMDRDEKAYQDKCEKRRKAANIRWGNDVDETPQADDTNRFRPAPSPASVPAPVDPAPAPADEADASTPVVEVARPNGSTPLPVPSDEPRPITQQDVMDVNLAALKQRLTAAGVRMAFADYAIMVEWINAVGYTAVNDAVDTAIRQAAGSVHYVFTILQRRQQKSRRSYSPAPAPAPQKKLTESEEAALAAQMEAEMLQMMEKMAGAK